MASTPVPSVTYTGTKMHDTRGLKGYPAVDIMAPGGTSVVAPEDGTIVKLSGHDPKTGVHGGDIYGWSVYLLGKSGKKYYLTHLGSRAVNMGETVTAGQELGTVGDWPGDPGRSHVHFGVSGGNAATIAATAGTDTGTTSAAAPSQALTPADSQPDTIASSAAPVQPPDPYSAALIPQVNLPGEGQTQGVGSPAPVAQLWAQVAAQANASPETLQIAQLNAG